MTDKIKEFIKGELVEYNNAFASRNYKQAFNHLERIHIVSQPYAIEHTITHLRMLRFALQTFKPLEIIVQVLYSLLGGILSLIGFVPIGNTGGANAISKGAMEIPNDLKQIMNT